MSAPYRRPLVRGSQFLRQWQLLLRLRQGRATLPELAKHTGCTERTVRRDLYLLRAVGLPVRVDYGADLRGVWSVGSIPAWPRNEVLPVRPLRGMELR